MKKIIRYATLALILGLSPIMPGCDEEENPGITETTAPDQYLLCQESK